MISDNTKNIPARPGEARATLANCDKIYSVFGWKPQVKLEDWIRENG
jgi:UDP-glucose 4-epimerase